jgi:hypothetical protein
MRFKKKNTKIILPVVLYWRGILYLTLKEEHRLRVSENRVLRRIFGPKREEVARDWRRLHNEELRNINTSRNIITIIKSGRARCAGQVTRMREIREA